MPLHPGPCRKASQESAGMIEIETVEDARKLFASLEQTRRLAEDNIQTERSVYDMYCVYCRRMQQMSMHYSEHDWVDLRGQFACSGCGLSNRDRLFLKAMRHSGVRPGSDGLVFERVTHFYNILNGLYGNLRGVEFGGYDVSPGAMFESRYGEVEHQDMQATSYHEGSFDYVLHGDVLEHMPDPFRAIEDNLRILKPGGVILFSTPIFTGMLEHQKTAELDEHGGVRFLGQEMYHGDPLSDEGVPVFYLFGINILDTINALGGKASYLVDHSLLEGIVSNNNPYLDVGHMWPLVVKVTRPDQS